MNSPYPTAESIIGDKGPAAPAPGGAPAPEGGKGADSNPMARIIEAVQTIAAFIAVLEEKQDPKAVAAKAALGSLIGALTGKEGGAPAEEKPGEAEGPGMAPHPAGPMGGGRPMMGGSPAGAPAGARVL